MKLAIVGAGMAAARLLKALVDSDLALDITVFGAEPELPYNRLQLSALLAGDYERSALPMLSKQWLAENAIEVRTGDAVCELNTASRRLQCLSGYSAVFDRIVLATGAQAIIPDLSGVDLRNVVSFRTLADFDVVESVFGITAKLPKALVVGGGVLGLEIAHGLSVRGADVTLVHSQQRLMNRQLDEHCASILQTKFEHRGIDIRLGCRVNALRGDKRLESVTLSNGDSLAADLLVFATGIAPNVDLARDSELQVERGVVVDKRMQSSVEHIYAVGECAQFAGETVGIVAPIWQQIDALLHTLAVDESHTTYCPRQYGTKLKVSGIDLFAIGNPEIAPSSSQTVLKDKAFGVYRRLIFDDNRLRAAFLIGDCKLASHYEELVQNEHVLTNMQQQQLMFTAL